jgi:hypothetical protein
MTAEQAELLTAPERNGALVLVTSILPPLRQEERVAPRAVDCRWTSKPPSAFSVEYHQTLLCSVAADWSASASSSSSDRSAAAAGDSEGN